MVKKQKGFTLIELMIVIAILGILASIAIPAYRDFTIRARISEAIYAAAAVKTTVTEFHTTNGTFPANRTDAGVLLILTDYISGITIVGGVIAIDINEAATGVGAIPGVTTMWVRMAPTAPTNVNAVYNWTCSVDSEADGSGSSFTISRFVPPECR